MPSHEATGKLIRDFVQAMLQAPEDGPEHRLALIVAGQQAHAAEVAELAEMARGQRDADGFFGLVQTPEKFQKSLVRRLGYVTVLVEDALRDLGVSDWQNQSLVRMRTWGLLSRLWVLMWRLELPDFSDWDQTQNSLLGIARGSELASAARLRDCLEVLAAKYAPMAAHVDRGILVREVGALLRADYGKDPDGHRATGPGDPRGQTGRMAAASPLYAEVARSIAPAKGLRGRDGEVAELAAFCADGDRSYVWWQADAWAGKSALLASFVVDPPPGVVPVSFFITAPQSGQNTSAAFLRDVTAQLEALSGTSQPPLASPRDQVLYLHRLLRECASLACADGQRLVLVVDGLDEDSSRSVGLSSIASMLPKRPEHGSKVIVAGRRNPGLPGDAPADHPLQEPGTARELPVSDDAIARKNVAAEELAHLLEGGSGLGRDMLGFLVAAYGGLSAQDMADLAERPRHEVDKVLGSAPGRTFTPRPIIITRDVQDSAFIFSHEKLSGEAESKLGKALVRAYRDRLHTWAGTYRDRGWPAEDTPVYLLRGYGEMLRQEHDVPRLMALAADGARIDWMLDVTGSDADAITEVDAAIDVAVARRNPDLADAALLGYQRDRLADRNSGLPARLPAAWARTGQLPRAEALAASFGGESRVQALAWTSIALNDVGEKVAAGRLTEMACDQLRQIDRQEGGYPRWAGAVASALPRSRCRNAANWLCTSPAPLTPC